MSISSLLSQMVRSKSSDSTINDSLLNLGSFYASDLRSYKKACELDPELKSFDATLQRSTDQVISSLAPGPEGQPLSSNSLIKLISSLLDMNREVPRFIIQSKEDLSTNKDLMFLVEAYFDSSAKTLDFCCAVENSVKQAEISQISIQLAVKQFDKEPGEGVAQKKYEKTLEELKKFKAASNPFTEDLFTHLQSVYSQQVSLLKKLHEQKERLDEKMKKLKSWRQVWNAMFATAFVSVLIFKVVAAAVTVPPVVAALANALPVLMLSMGKWASSLWEKYENAVKAQEVIVSEMMTGTLTMKEETRNIFSLVKRLGNEFEDMQKRAGIAIINPDEAVRIADDIRKKLYVFMQQIEDLRQHAANCYNNVLSARTIVLKHISSRREESSKRAGSNHFQS